MDKNLIDQEIARAEYHKDAHQSLYLIHRGKGEWEKAEMSRLAAGTWQAIADKLRTCNL